jgi:hypothetical protein
MVLRLCGFSPRFVILSGASALPSAASLAAGGRAVEGPAVFRSGITLGAEVCRPYGTRFFSFLFPTAYALAKLLRLFEA